MTEDKSIIPSTPAFFAIDGRKIKAVREEQKLTQLYVATSLGVTVDTISRWENGRSPTIKLENAEKLAEVLGLELAEIEDRPAPPQQAEPTSQQEALKPASSPSAARPTAWLLWLAGALLAATLLFFLFPDSSPEQNVQLKVQRLLPPHAALNHPFPVVLKVTAQGKAPLSFILKEQVGDNCQVIEGRPAFMVVNQQQRFIKWLSQNQGEGPHYFSYLAQAGSEAKSGDTLSFNGQSKVVDAGEAPVAGDKQLIIAKYHWADANRDYAIDDEEILTLYNSFQVMQELGIDVEEIRRIWANNGYGWDEDLAEFVALEPEAGEKNENR